MIFRTILVAIIIIAFLIALVRHIKIYNLLDKPEIRVKKSWLNWFKIFNKPIFKIPIGIFIIAITSTYLFKIVKVLPPIEKLGLICLDFIIIYAVVNLLFKNKK